MPKEGWSSISLSTELMEEIDQIINSNIGKKYGFKSRADFITRAIIDCLKEYQPQYQLVPRFMHTNTYDDHATIRDNLIGREINIYFKNGGVAYCEFCNGTDCEHITYTLTLSEVTEPLEKRGWKSKV